MAYDVVKEGAILKLLKDGKEVDRFNLDKYHDIRKWTRDKAFSWFGSYNEGLCPIVHRHLKEMEFKHSEGRKVWEKAIKFIADHLKQKRIKGVIRLVPKENRQVWREIVRLSKRFESEWEPPYKIGDLPKLRFRIRSLGIPFCEISPYDSKGKLETVLKALKKLKDVPGEKWERTEMLFNEIVPEEVRAWIETGAFNKELYGQFVTDKSLEEVFEEIKKKGKKRKRKICF